jgi:prophage regulatory protein
VYYDAHGCIDVHHQKWRKMMEQFLKIGGVENIVELKKSKIYQMVKVGEFPSGILIGRRTRRWTASEIEAWINQKIKGEKI